MAEEHRAPGAREDVRHWPPGSHYDDADLLDGECPQCGIRWRAHRDLAGYALICECGADVEFAPPRDLVDARNEMSFASRDDVTRALRRDGEEDLPPLRDDFSTSELPPPGTVGRSGVRLRVRWKNRAFLELAAVMTAFVAPALFVHLTEAGSRRGLLMPLASLAASLLVLAIGATARSLTFGGLRRTGARFLAEGVAVGLLGGLLALGWVAFVRSAIPGVESGDLHRLREVIGWPMAFFVIGFCPAVFEELAFRGLLHARLVALVGVRQGMLATGAMFALAHGITLGLPFHMALGVYLSWVRHRSRSLLPGMLLHFVYNGTLLLALASD